MNFSRFVIFFVGASIALMRWQKLYPLVAKVDLTYNEVITEIEAFSRFIEQNPQQT